MSDTQGGRRVSRESWCLSDTSRVLSIGYGITLFDVRYQYLSASAGCIDMDRERVSRWKLNDGRLPPWRRGNIRAQRLGRRLVVRFEQAVHEKSEADDHEETAHANARADQTAGN